MNYFQHINKQECLSIPQISENGISSPTIPLILHEPYIENMQPCFPQVGAESLKWVLCYSDDIFAHWQRIEKDLLKVNYYSNMVTVRPQFIDILRDLRSSYGLENTTLHLAVYIFDNFLSRRSEQLDLKLILITSLLIAAKAQDVEAQIPSFVEMNKTILNNAFTLLDYRKVEAKMLFCLNFGLMVPTVATFADYFSRISVVLDDFRNYQQSKCIIYGNFERYDEMLTAVNQLLQRLVDLTLDIVTLLNVPPSRKAAACMAVARLLYNVQPVWTPFLEMESCYSEADIRPVMDVIISMYKSNSSTCGSLSEKNDTSSIDDSPCSNVTNASVQDSPNSDY